MLRWHPNGRIESELNYTGGMLDGPVITYDKKGNRIKEEHYNMDTLNGPFRQWYSDGTPKVEGAYLSGLFAGQWVYYDPAGNIVGIGDFTEGTGVQKGWWPNGNLKREIHYRNNLKHGTETWYDQDGMLEQQINYREGKRISGPFGDSRKKDR